MSEKFDWFSKSDDIVVPPVSAIAVYTNPEHNIVIRQQDPYGEEDSFVVIPPSMINAVIKALKDEVKKVG